MENKLIKKRIGGKELDSVQHRKDMLGDTKRDIRLLERARNAWNNMTDFREQRARAMRFVYADQWGDYITVKINGEKRTMTMREYLSMEGHIPQQTNQLKTDVNTIVGVLIKEQNEPVCNAIDREEQQYGELITRGLQANNKKNRINMIYKLCAKDLIIGGLGVMHEHYGYREGDRRRVDSWSKYIDPNYVIMETTLRDPRFWDMTMIGCWYRMSFNAVVAQFAGHNGITYKKLNDIYMGAGSPLNDGDYIELTDANDLKNLEFMHPVRLDECCVAEIWTQETKERIRVHDYNEGTEEFFDADDSEMIAEIERINAARKKLGQQQGLKEEEIPYIEIERFVDVFWELHMLAPDGTVLWEEESPYPDRSHPFSIMMTPFIDGRICGYITDGIDHQIAMNRAVVLQDWIVRNQIKGFTMIPKQLVPDGMTNEDFVENSLHLGNFFFYDAEKARGLKPEVFHSGAISYDASNYIKTLKQLMESSTAISGSIQGKTPYAGTSAALYAQQTANSSTPIASLLSDVRQFMEDSATKKAKNIAAFYDTRRWELIVGSVDGIFDNANLNLNNIADLEFDLIIRESNETPVYRAIANDTLLGFFNAGAIDLPTLLECGSFPFGDRLLQKIQARQAEMQSAQEGEMGAAAQNAAAQMQNPVRTEGFGVPVG